MTKTYTRTLTLLSLLIFSSFSFAQTSFNSAKMDSLVTALESHNKMMGSVAILKNGQIIYTKAFGFYGISGDKQLHSTPETEYHIGSISKMFTATMIFQLIEENKLTLETNLSKFFPQVPNAKKITMLQLLSHRSGLHNVTEDSDYDAWNTIPQTHEQMLKRFSEEKPVFAPGAKREYSNTNFILLGYIIEKITGDSYANELKKRITDKIGLTHTYYGSKINPEKNEANSYQWDDGKWMQASETDMSVPGGAGAIVSTPSDLTKFVEALLTYKLVSEKSVDLMKPKGQEIGMGMFIIPFGKHISYGHTGGIDGFSSMVGYFPQDSFAFAITFNGANYSGNNVAIALLSIYFNMPYAIPSFEEKTDALSPDQLAAYEGVYSTPKMPMKITVKKEKDKLTAQGTGQPPFPLDNIGKNKFEFAQGGIRMEFVQLKDGGITGFHLLQSGADILFTKEK